MKINIKKNLAYMFLLLFCICLAGCTKSVEVTQMPMGNEKPGNTKESADPSAAPGIKEPEKKKTETAKPERKNLSLPFSQAVNTFNWNFYDTLDTDSNLFYSPASLESALAMTFAGAKGETFDELADILCISDADAFMDDYSSLSMGYGSDKARLTVANSLWIDETFEKQHSVDPGFISKLEDKMDAEVIMEDFSGNPGKASDDISGWVKDKTEGFIKDYRSVSTSETVLDIINAIYFYGEWENKFDACDTYEMEFRNKDGESSVDMMNMHDSYFRYIDNGTFKGIELPYADDSAVMDIILSSDDEALDTPGAFKSLSAKEREDLISQLSSADEAKIHELRLPKFSMDLTCEDLKETLEGMGLVSAFDKEKADFSGIAENIYISDIAHRAKIEVDEEGSRAAAVTEITMNVTGMLIEEKDRKEFICDRPFVFVIRDKSSGTILFTGVVNEP